MASIISRLFRIGKGHVMNAAEDIADANAITELDQLMRECDDNLKKSKQNLTDLSAKRQMQDDKIATLQGDVEKYTDGAKRAKAADDMTLAMECAERVMKLQADITAAEILKTQYGEAEETIRQSIKDLTAKKAHFQAEIDSIKATEQMQAAQSALASSSANVNSSFSDAEDSLKRIKARQQEKAARLKASQTLDAQESGKDLDAKLKGLGGGSSSAQSFLDTL